jgi:hypothetical protein
MNRVTVDGPGVALPWLVMPGWYSSIQTRNDAAAG